MPVCVCITSKVRVMIMSMPPMSNLSVLRGATLRRKDRFPPRFRISGREFAFGISPKAILPLNFRLCWEQNVHVIVMLTREIEGSMVKCGAYWAGTTFGPLRLRLMSTSSQSPPENMDNGAGYFPLQPPLGDDTKPCRQPTTIKRIFELTHGDYPHMKPRKVVHLQFLEWPDMNVPDDPHGVLELIREVEKAVEETRAVDQASMEVDEGGTDLTAANLSHVELDERTGVAKHAMGKNSPVLLHCSAGVGRTGGFIAVDAVLDAVRRELRKSIKVVSKPNQTLCRRVSSVDFLFRVVPFKRCPVAG